MSTSLTSLALPPGIHATILTGMDASTSTAVAVGIVWADRTYRQCGTCQQPVRDAGDTCPVTLDGIGQPEEWSQRHSDIGGYCGVWQPIIWAECGGTSDGEILAAATALAARRGDALAEGRAEITATLTAGLTRALARLAEPLADGETAEDRAAEVTTGRDDLPGVYFDQFGSGEWIAWDYDPDDTDESSLITVYASDPA